MRKALILAQKGEGYTSPNPMVGCVIVSSNGDLIGEGYHERFGREHAEVLAIDSVEDRHSLLDATLYVTLEPCSHHGKTPPCCEMVGKLPLRRVVVAMEDPNPKVSGRGIRYLEERGISVECGLLRAEAEALNRFYLHHLEFGRPFVTLKIAQTSDGYTAAPDGGSRWITGKESRTLVHRWRSRYDAVMVGRNTAELDNPTLTVRHIEGRQPLRVVIDGPLSLPSNLHLFSDQYEEKTILITHNEQRARETLDPMLKMMQSNYFRGKTLVVPERDGHSDLHRTMKALGEEGVTSLLVEAGQSLSSALLRAGLVDRLELFIAPVLLGGGTRSVLGLGIQRIEDMIPFREVEWQQVGADMLMSATF